MPLPRTTSYCPICGNKLFGRLDKIFCSSSCKAKYHRNKTEERLSVTRPIDAILHRNWTILSEFHLAIGKRKFFVEITRLNRKGFHLNYFTTHRVNAQRKAYFYVYDFAWMQFSEKDVLVVKLNKPA